MATDDALCAISTDAAMSPYEYRPQSLWECYSLLCNALPRDHLLVKGLEKRNRVCFSDIITGVSTESETESLLRRSMALDNVPVHIGELNARNVAVLGEGLVRKLLAIETDTDDDGVPLEADEENVTNVVGSLLAEMRLKSDTSQTVDNLVSSILGNKEVLFYTKYKLLKSVDYSVRCLADCHPRHSPSLCSHSSPSVSSGSLLPKSSRSELARIRESYRSTMARTVSREIDHVVKDEQQMKFVGHVFVIELMNTLMKMYQDVSDLEPAVMSIGNHINRANYLDPDLIKNYLRMLLLDKRIMIELVEDDEIVNLLRRVMRKLEGVTTLEPEAKTIIRTVRECIDPYFV